MEAPQRPLWRNEKNIGRHTLTPIATKSTRLSMALCPGGGGGGEGAGQGGEEAWSRATGVQAGRPEGHLLLWGWIQLTISSLAAQGHACPLLPPASEAAWQPVSNPPLTLLHLLPRPMVPPAEYNPLSPPPAHTGAGTS